MGAPAKARTGKADNSGKPSKPHIPAKGAVKAECQNKGEMGRKG